jgi:hypothetical protein
MTLPLGAPVIRGAFLLARQHGDFPPASASTDYRGLSGENTEEAYRVCRRRRSDRRSVGSANATIKTCKIHAARRSIARSTWASLSACELSSSWQGAAVFQRALSRPEIASGTISAAII